MATLSPTILRAKPNSEGKYPVWIRISVKKDKSYIKTDYCLNDPCEWYEGKVVARSDASAMNKRLTYEVKRYTDKLKYIENEDYYSANQLKAILTQEDKAAIGAKTFNEYFQKRIEEIRKEGREGYADMNKETLRVFELSEGEIPMPIMNSMTVEHFYKYMQKRGYSDGNIQIRLGHVRARVNEAIKAGLIKTEKHPFSDMKLPSPDSKVLDIEVSDFQKILKLDTNNSKRITLAKDLFLLSFYLGGLNLSDIVEIDFSGSVISYCRKKSKAHKKKNRITQITIPKEAKPIINRYITANGTLDFGYEFEYKNFCRYLNKCIKLLAQSLNIESNMSFYSARKTFAQYASDLALPYPVIEYCLGHSVKTNITINKYIRIKPQQADAAIQRVIEYTQNPDAFKEFITFRAQMQMMMM